MSVSIFDFKQNKYVPYKPGPKKAKAKPAPPNPNAKPYCGAKKVPKGERRGTSTECYFIGRKAGFVGGISKSNVKLTQTGLGQLRKDVLREIAYRFNVKNYSHMLKADLINNILAKKGNKEYFNLMEFKKEKE